MKKALAKIAMGFFLIAAIAINAFPLLASTILVPAEPTDGYKLYDDPQYCPPGYHWSHCIVDSLSTCDVHAQHECEPNENTW
jgi:hypothetical protein